MIDEPSFLRAILEQPLDDGPRLIYADFLDERGDPESLARAEFIRVQCALSRIPRDAPERLNLRNREEVLLQNHWRSWLKPACQALGEPLPVSGRQSRYELHFIDSEFRSHSIHQTAENGNPYLMAAQFRRGFVSRLYLHSKTSKSASYFTRFTERCPLESLSLQQFTPMQLQSLLQYAPSSGLIGLELLFFSPQALNGISPQRFPLLRELVLNYCQDQTHDIADEFLKNPFERIRRLSLRSCKLENETLERLLNLPMMANIERLVFERCQLDNRSAQIIAAQLQSPNLEVLDLSENSFNQRSLALLRSRFGTRFLFNHWELTRPELFAD